MVDNFLNINHHFLNSIHNFLITNQNFKLDQKSFLINHYHNLHSIISHLNLITHFIINLGNFLAIMN